MKDLSGKVALVTGGSKGIGYGIAEAMVKQGMKVVVTSRSQKAADEAANKLNNAGSGEAVGMEANVRNFDAQQKVVEQLMEKFGQLDVVIANAGLGHFGSVEELSVEQWNEVVETNLNGAFYTLKASIDGLKKSEGYYITISSLAGTNFFAGGAAYNASKFGVTGFTQAAMLDLRKYGIKTTTIMPGSVSTYFNDNEPSDKDSWKIQIEDLGQMVIDLLNMHQRSLPSKIEVRPTTPPQK